MSSIATKRHPEMTYPLTGPGAFDSPDCADVNPLAQALAQQLEEYEVVNSTQGNSVRKERAMTAEHFLVPVDFSEYSDHALDYALSLASQLQSRLTLLHVIQPLMVGGADIGMVPYAYAQQLEEETRESMQKCLDRINAAGLKGEGMVVHGVPWQEIVDMAKNRHNDLIIMGTHGRTGIKHVLLGSVAEKVVRLAPCPVLVVRLPENQDE